MLCLTEYPGVSELVVREIVARRRDVQHMRWGRGRRCVGKEGEARMASYDPYPEIWDRKRRGRWLVVGRLA